MHRNFINVRKDRESRENHTLESPHQCFPRNGNKKRMETNSKNCPNCIEQIDGCNKMHCTFCNVHFCRLCGEKITGEDPCSHFWPGFPSCAGLLFQGTVVDEDAPLEADEEALNWELNDWEVHEDAPNWEVHEDGLNWEVHEDALN